ncbi:hypothetical protein QIS74_03329 [Colletotrichum tabaci]|uniref:Uncharacterized protein n=1 Tax=Colletotrichum tabaci TaxID=1209068 RepID=A0AAV9TNT4_9PEZI
MFGGSRRHRQPNQPLTAATANPNAATAAASAFARRASSSSLSSAAAAAALRSRPTTPINVAEVQTKRTQRRSASVSSHGSQDTRRGMHRSPSQSSMTERTFRSPSPHRTPMTAEDAPPVPTIPDDMRSITNQSSSHKRATSLQMQPFRVASQKKQEGAGSWFGAAAEGNMANVRTSDALMRVASPESRPGAVSPTSSINFSYPRMPGASPAASPTVESMTMTVSQRLASPRRPESVNSRMTTTSDQSLVYDPNSRRMVPKVDLLAREQSVREAAERPVQKKKKKQQQQQQGLARSGSHLAKGTVGRVQGSAVVNEESAPLAAPRQQQPQVRALTGAPVQKTLQNQPQTKETVLQISAPREAPEPAPTPVQASARAPVVPDRSSTTVDVGPAHQHSASSPEVEQPVVQDVRKSDGATILPHSEPRQGAPILGRKPSTVQEESEDELTSSEDDAELSQEPPSHREVADVLRAVPVRSSAPPKQPSLSSESTAVESPVNVSSQRQSSPSQQKQHGSVRNARAQSASPARSARFALGPDQLVIRHEPPPRSVSPRKSAMKHSTSPSRGASPSDESSEASGPSRFGSEVTAAEVPMPRKKSVRVSFDDENTKVVGKSTAKPEIDSPTPPSPQQTKRHWYNHLGRNRKKDAVALDDDEIMKPRPALPSFGSVREKKPRDAEEERPLVRPLESPPPSDPNTPERNQERAVPNGQSNDYNIGTILSQEQTARNAANISRFREPLPPVVTSLEGSGYYSPTGTDTDDEGDEVFQDLETVQEPECTLPSEQVKEEIIAAHPKLADDTLLPPMQAVPTLDKSIDRNHREEDVPSISVIQPTPTPRETAGNGSADLSEQGYFDVPGGFPEDESEDSVSYPRTQPELAAVTKDRHQEQTTVFNGAATPAELAAQPVPAEETESEGASIYSDAYEDLSDVDGNGFMSLDAVVASPVPNKVSHKLYQKAMANSSQQTPVDSHANNIPEDVPDFSQLSGSSQQPEDEWERAKVYWRGLTSDKRKQLEQEALEEAGAEGDLEEVVQPVKAKRKRSVRKSDSATQQQASVNPERVYQIQPGTVVIDEGDEEEPPATMLKTLRGRQSQETGPANGRLQKTMRGGQTPISAAPGTGLRKTLRSDTPSARSSQPPEPPVMGAVQSLSKAVRQAKIKILDPNTFP